MLLNSRKTDSVTTDDRRKKVVHMFLPTLVKWNGDSVCHLLLTLVQETLKSVEVISNFLTDFYKDKQLNALHFSCALVRSQSTVVKRDIQTKLR